MSKPRLNIKKIIASILWLIAGIGLVVILVAAISKSNDAYCAGVEILIRGEGGYRFLDKQKIHRLLSEEGYSSFKGRPVTAFNLRRMESAIHRNVWVKDAELYFDKEKVLQVKVNEKEPIARIFTGSGISWFIDSAGTYLPLSQGQQPVKLPVFTGLPEKLKPSLAADSALLQHIKSIAGVLKDDPFWMAQVTQIAMTPERNFELVPLIGNHIIRFGDGNNALQKFHRLEVFYKNVLCKTGFDYYSVVNVQFDKQVIGERAEGISTTVDKIKLPYATTIAPLLVERQSQTTQPDPPNQSQRKPESSTSTVQPNAEKRPKAVMKKQTNPKQLKTTI